MDAALLFGKNPKMLLCALFFYHFIQGSVKVYARYIQTLPLAVSKNARVPSAPKSVLIASLSTLVLPCLRSDFSLISPSLFPLLVLVFMASRPTKFLPLHPHPVPSAMTLACGCLFCLSMGFATVVTVMGKEIHKKSWKWKADR